MDKFLYVPSVRKSPEGEGWHYLSVYSRSKTTSVSTLVEGILKSSHEWKPMYFFLSDEFGRHPADGPEPIGVCLVQFQKI